MNSTIIVKKLYSLNPIQFKNLTLKEASKDYALYLDAYLRALRVGTPKSFISWLESEI